MGRQGNGAAIILDIKNEKPYRNYQRVFNRAKWDELNGAKILLNLIIKLLPPGLPLIIGVDESIERRKGKKIKAKGCYRDAVRSSKRKVVYCFGLKWICMLKHSTAAAMQQRKNQKKAVSLVVEFVFFNQRS